METCQRATCANNFRAKEDVCKRICFMQQSLTAGKRGAICKKGDIIRSIEGDAKMHEQLEKRQEPKFLKMYYVKKSSHI